MIVEQKNDDIIEYYRDENNQRQTKVVTDFVPYFYYSKDEKEIKDPRIVSVEDAVKKTIFGESVKKIIVKAPYDVPKLRTMFLQTYEADVPYIWRYYIDRITEIPRENLRKFYLDIETADMPDTHLDNQPITCIGIYDNYTDYDYTFIIDSNVENVTVENREKHIINWCKTEYLLLDQFIKFVMETDPDMIIAHNGDRFDFPVIVGRFIKLMVMGYGKMSPIGSVKRNNSFGEWKTKVGGRIMFDFLGAKTGYGVKGGIRGLLDGRDITVKDEEGNDKIVRIKRWSLGYLAQFVGMEKGEYAKVQTNEEMIKYNKQDVHIMLELDRFFNVTQYYQNMSVLIGCPYEATYFNTSLIDFFLMKRFPQYVFPTKPARGKFDNDAIIKGADVTEPKQGLYQKLNVVDQTSLYPSTIVTWNMSPETLDPNGDLIVGNGIRFTSEKIGIIPDAVQFLLDIRLKYKKLAKTEPDPHLAQMYDLLSGGYKTLLVSFYGALLYRGFRLYQHDVAECIPYIGRVIKTQHVQQICESNGYEIVFGDSVTRDAVVPIQDINGYILFKRIEDLYIKTDLNLNDKEYYQPCDLKTLSVDKNGTVSWNKIKNVMRHKTSKKIYNVAISNKWSINVTEDHSLIGYANHEQMKRLKLTENFIETKPIDIGKKLNSIVSMKYIPRDNIISKNYPRELYELLGLFIGDGSLDITNGKIYFINISSGNDTFEIIDKVIEPLHKMGYIDKYHIRRNGYDMRMNGKILSIINEWFDSRIKIIPDWIKYETEQNISSFIKGMFESDGSISKRNGTYIITFVNIREDFINKLQELLWYTGVPSGICKENNSNKYNGVDSGTYTLRLNIRNNMNYKNIIGFITDRKQNILNNVVSGSRKGSIENLSFDVVNHLKVSDMEYNDYVYDLEVENVHTFFANGILVHNTDSSALNAIRKDATPIDDLVDIINKSFDQFALDHGVKHHILNIELDKVYSPIIVSDVKKRYVGYLEKGGKKIYKVTGFEAVRRDTAVVTEEMQETVFKMILNGKSQKEVEVYITELKEKCINGEIPLASLMLPKGFSKSFKGYKHANLWIRGTQYSNKYLGTHFDQHSEVGAFHIKRVPEGQAHTDIVCIDEDTADILKGYLIDWDEQLNKTIDSKFENIKNMMGWIHQEQKTLFEF